MPEEIRLYSCKHCGKLFEDPGVAKTCEILHVPAEDLQVSHIEPHLSSGKAYPEGDRMPAALMIKGISADASGLYIKYDQTLLKRAADGVLLT